MTDTANPRCLVITKTADQRWHMVSHGPQSVSGAVVRPPAWVSGTSELDVFVKCAQEGWALVSASRGTGGTGTYYFRQTTSDPLDGLTTKVDLRGVRVPPGPPA
jgi:hypothetical protein